MTLLTARLLLLLAAPTGAGHVYFEQLTLTRVDGKLVGPGVMSRVWFAGHKMRLEGGAPGGPALILRLDTGLAFRLDPAHRTVVVLDLERLRARSHLDLAMAGDLMGVGQHATTRALTGTRRIAGYACRGFRIRGGETVLDVYVSDRIPLGIDAFLRFLEWSGATQSMAGLMSELRRLPGFPLETRSRVSVLGRVHETSSRVTRVSLDRLDDALFDAPAGYRREPEARPQGR